MQSTTKNQFTCVFCPPWHFTDAGPIIIQQDCCCADCSTHLLCILDHLPANSISTHMQIVNLTVVFFDIFCGKFEHLMEYDSYFCLIIFGVFSGMLRKCWFLGALPLRIQPPLPANSVIHTQNEETPTKHIFGVPHSCFGIIWLFVVYLLVICIFITHLFSLSHVLRTTIKTGRLTLLCTCGCIQAMHALFSNYWHYDKSLIPFIKTIPVFVACCSYPCACTTQRPGRLMRHDSCGWAAAEASSALDSCQQPTRPHY